MRAVASLFGKADSSLGQEKLLQFYYGRSLVQLRGLGGSDAFITRRPFKNKRIIWCREGDFLKPLEAPAMNQQLAAFPVI